jgi:hypothetical protein
MPSRPNSRLASMCREATNVARNVSHNGSKAHGKADDVSARRGAEDGRSLAAAMISIANSGAHVGATDVTTWVTDEGEVVRRSNRLDAAILHTQAKAALIALGWKPAIAAAAVAAARQRRAR